MGTSYEYSRIRSHANNNGFIGYAELNCSSSYDMIIHIQATRTNGWVYHNIKGDNFALLSGSGPFVKYSKPLVSSSDDRLKENK